MSDITKGQLLALTLLKELEIPPGVKQPPTTDLEVVDSVPSDIKFFSHQQNYVQFFPVREALLDDMLKNQSALTASIAFCCASLETDKSLAFDIDHVFPRAKITEKQRLLLEFLNKPSNADLTQDFINTQGISNYFKRDSAGVIKGTNWFFKVCYNSLNNLFHLKHYLNTGKSAQTPGVWLEQNFPPEFMDAVKRQGGINEGIIMQQVFPIIDVAGSPLHIINIGSAENPMQVHLHNGAGIGLGTFIRTWFKDHPVDVIPKSDEIHKIHQSLTKMLAAELNDDGSHEGVKKFLLIINGALKVAEYRRSINAESSSDSSDAKDARYIVSSNLLKEGLDFMHALKKIKRNVLSKVGDEHNKLQLSKEFYITCLQYWLPLSRKEQINAANIFIAKHEELASVTPEQVRNFIIEAGNEADSEKIALAAEAGKAEAEAGKAEAEAGKAEAEARKAEAEARSKIAIDEVGFRSQIALAAAEARSQIAIAAAEAQTKILQQQIAELQQAASQSGSLPQKRPSTQ